MRAGRKLRKTLVDQQKTKPCFVRLEKVRQEKHQSSSQDRMPASRKLTGPLKKRPLNTQISVKLVEEKSQNTLSQVVKRVQQKSQNTPSPVVKRVQEYLQNTPSPVVKRIQERSQHTPSQVVKIERPQNTPNQIVKKVQNSAISSVKRVQDSPHNISLSAAVKKVLQRVNKPGPASKKLLQRPPSTQSKQIEKKVQPRPLSVSQVVKKVRAPPTTVASTRTRRAPKPNPKYSNADIITPKVKSSRVTGLIAFDDADNGDSDSTEDFYNTLDDSSLGSDANDVGDAFLVDDDSSDFSDGEEIKPRRQLRCVPPPATNTLSNGPKRGRPKKILIPQTSVKPTFQPKKIVMPSQPVQRTMLQQLQQARKRKLEELDDDVEPAESIIARNKRLNIALYDANVAKPVPTLKSDSYKGIRQVVRSKNRSPAPSNVIPQKRTLAGPNSLKTSQAAAPKEISRSPQIARRSPAAKAMETADSASTQDDFETMPTFTIVNIHDIINKKGDCLIQKNADEEEKGTISPNATSKVNRRKSGHTTILSEKMDPGKMRNPLPRTPFPPKKPMSTILNSKPMPRSELKLQSRLSAPPPERKPVQPVVIQKPAPRILNSVVAKRTYPVKPILGKLENDIDLEGNDDPVEKTQMVKENVGANKLVPLKATQPRKLPPEKVFVQRQGNKLIKKITCFETWYVINIPETQELVVKNCLDIPLIDLANASKTIRLPSLAWSSKVTLFKLSAQMLSKNEVIPYTGDTADQSIPEEDRDKYQPSCVMFRRMTQQKSKTRMPYDRAVIFKMKTFFTNIDGKNVRLIGAPSTVKSFEDIGILLELIDELDLVHEFVEPASTV